MSSTIEPASTTGLRALLPPSTAVVEAFADDPDDMVVTGEESLLQGAVQSRRREFVTSRRCARSALLELGHPAGPIGRGRGREPLWPRGVVGSITHCAGYRAAAVTRQTAMASLGIDAEPHEALPPGVLDTVMVSEERDMLTWLATDHPEHHWDRLLFSAKESVYKAWYPLTSRWLGFEDASVTMDPVWGTFTASITIDGRRIDGGPPLAEINGRYHVKGGLILTAVVVPVAS